MTRCPCCGDAMAAATAGGLAFVSLIPVTAAPVGVPVPAEAPAADAVPGAGLALRAQWRQCSHCGLLLPFALADGAAPRGDV